MHIKNWNASRSGAAMTIRGTDEADDSPVVLANIAKIEARGRDVVAIERNTGVQHILRVA